MPQAEFRFYEELNDFLAPGRRKRPFAYHCARQATVKQAIEALGVSHTEVELILANGESVDFSYRIVDGDRISAYPQFESFDITPVLRVRDRPLRSPRFIADAHLGALAKHLRMLGFDTCYEPALSDAQLAAAAAEQRRILLTRDRDLLMHRVVSHGCYVRATQPLRQLEELVKRLDLGGAFSPFTRCMECNAALESAALEAVATRLPPGTAAYYDRFSRCPGCERIYWPGSHYRRMRAIIDKLSSRARPPD